MAIADGGGAEDGGGAQELGAATRDGTDGGGCDQGDGTGRCGGTELTYAALVVEAIRCCHEGHLWRDPTFSEESSQPEVGEHVCWRSLADIFGWPAPHVWPDGRRSYLYS